MKKNVFYFAFIILTFFSCQKEIDIDLNSSDPKMVIEANYIANEGKVRVLVSKSSNYFDVFQLSTIDDAIVTIQEESGSAINVPLLSNGTYELTGLTPNFGSNYIIKVSHNGVVYEATSKLLPTLTLLPSYTEYQAQSIFSDEGYWIYYRFQDFPGLGNCYNLIPTYYGIRYDKFGEYTGGEDLLTDGNLVERPFIETFQIGDTVILELQSINQKVYNYNRELSSSGMATNAAVGNPNYFWSNKALGYFSAYSYSIDTVVIQ